MSLEALYELAEAAKTLQVNNRSGNPQKLLSVPKVTPEFLAESFRLAEYISLSDPWAAWKLCFVIAHATQDQGVSPSLSARAAWNLGWAANECTEPALAEQALKHAKQLFENQNEPGWTAACDWQLNTLPWTKSDFKQAKRDLEFALSQLKRSGLEPFTARCQLSLAQANILISSPQTLAEAQDLISAAEQQFFAESDRYWLLRSRLLRPSLLPRIGRRSEGVAILEELQVAFGELNARIDVARVNFQLALNYSMLGIQADKAAELFEQALAIFREGNLKLWEAHCLGGLGILFSQRGEFSEADEYLRQARKILQRYGVQGMLADNFNDSGRLAVIKGEYSLAKAQFQRAFKLNELLGSKRQSAIARTNLGHVYTKLGDAQNALIQLEGVHQELSDQLDAERLADSRLYLSSTWMRLGRYHEARRLLNQIRQHVLSEPRPLDFEASLMEAYSLIGLRQYEEAQEFVTDELKRWSNSESKAYIPLLSRMLGLILLTKGDLVEAEGVLDQALSEFKELGMQEEIASCLVVLGQLYAQFDRKQQAAAAWEEALQIVRDGASEVRIQCLTGLAELRDEQGEEAEAFKLYELALLAISSSLSTAWQPSIFSWHLASLSTSVDKAMNFFATHQFDSETFSLIEKIKAHAFSQSFGREELIKEPHTKVNLLHRNIDELLRLETGSRDWLDELVQNNQRSIKLEPLIDELEMQYGRLQRAGAQMAKPSAPDFQIHFFQRTANQNLGKKWIALDYYVADKEIVTALVTPDSAQIYAKKVSPRLKMALNGYTPQDLIVLANELLPDEIFAGSQERRTLFISPHKDLWKVPWAGLQVDGFSDPLVNVFTPVVLPSLSSLFLLQKRITHKSMTNQKRKGLFIGLSKFERLSDLPLVKSELACLQSLPRVEIISLQNQQATRANISALFNDLAKSQKGLDFLHLATHITYDPRSHHLCQIHLADGPVWFDELFDGIQLPQLVYLSACNGTASVTYEGGEQVGLPLTCLSKGAQAVIGFQRPIGDEAALRLMQSFYEQLLTRSGSLGETLAGVQSNLHTQGVPPADWMHVTFMGLPDLTL